MHLPYRPLRTRLSIFPLLGLLALPAVSHAAIVNWVNPAGGAWNVGANWSTGLVPGAADDAVISGAANFTVTVAGNPSINSISLGGGAGVQALQMTTQTMTLAAASSFAAGSVLNLSSSTLAGAGGVTLAGTTEVTGTSNIANPITTAASSVLRVSGNGSQGGGALAVANGFTNLGAIELTNSAPTWAAVLNVTAGTLVNATGATLGALAGSGGGGRTLGLELDNRGAVTIGQAASLGRSAAQHLNSGTIALTSGDLTLAQSGTAPSFTNTGTITVPASRTLAMTSGAFNLNAGSVSGAGQWTMSSATVNFAIPFATSTLAIVPNTSTLNGPALLTNSVGVTTTFNFCTVNAALSNLGTAVWVGSNTQSGALTTAASSVLRVSGNGSQGGGALTVANGFTNLGAIELTNSAPTWSAVLNVTAGTLVNATGATLGALAGSGGGGRTLGFELDNRGTVTIDQGATLTRSSAQHLNSGTISFASGDLTLSQSGTAPSFTNTGTITVPASRTLALSSGTFNLNAGTVSGAGQWTMSSATVNFAIPFATSTLAIVPSNSTLNGPAVLTNSAGVTTTFNFCTVNAALSNLGTAVWVGSNTQNGALTTAASSVLRVSGNGSQGGGALTVANGFTNLGAIELTNSAATWAAVLNVTAGTLVNATGATLGALAGSGGGGRTLGLELDNRGAVTIGQAASLGRSAAQHLNSGTIALTSGDLTLAQSGTAPSFTNTGTITVPASRTLAMTSGAFNLNAGSVSGAGQWTMSSATVNFAIPFATSTLAIVPNTSTLNGPALLTNSVGVTTTFNFCTVNAALSNLGTAVWVGSNTQSGALTTAASSVLRVSGNGSQGGGALTVANGFTNLGAIELTNSAPTWSAVLNVTAGTLVNATGATLGALAGSGGGGRTLGLELDNRGAVTIGQAASLGRTSAQHLNSGTIALASGDLTLSQSGTAPSFTNTGTISVSASRTLALTGGTFNLNAGTVSGAGQWTMSSATVNFAIPFATSTLAIVPSNSTLNGPAVLTNSAGVTTTFNFCTVNAALSNLGTAVWVGSNTQNGALTTAASSVLRVSGNGSQGGGALTVANGFTNLGAIELTNSAATWPATLNVTAGTLVNATGATLGALAGSGGGGRTLGLELNNQGIVTIGQAATLTRSSAQHLNSGTISLTAGDLTVSQGGTAPSFVNTGTIVIAASRTLVLTGTSAFTNAASGTLSGSGTYVLPASVAFSDAGTIRPGTSAGVLTITGVCPMTSTSRLAIELGGATVGTGFDQLAVSGVATLDGLLEISLINGFLPSVGQSFPVVTSGTRAGTFASITGLQLPGNLALEPRYSVTGLTLVVVSQTWVRLIPASASPTARDGHTSVTDPANARMIVFGGRGDAAPLADVWVLTRADGQGGDPAWVPLAPTGTPPPARHQHAAVYDAATNRMIVFGGDDAAATPTAFGDLWVLTNANGLGGAPAWTQLSPSGGPGVRSGASAVYDAAGNRMIVFGGSNAPATCGNAAADAWVLANANGIGVPAWSALSPGGTAPSGRMGQRAVYDAVNNRMIVHGGFQPCAAANGETWILSAANGVGAPAWTQLAPGGTPAAGLLQSAVHDPTNNRLIVFGGEVAGAPTGGVAVLAGANGLAGAGVWFDPVPTSGPPAARSRHSGAPLGQRMIVFGGLGASGRLADVWLLEETQGRVVDVPPVDPPAPRVLRTGFSRPPFPNPARGTARFGVSLASEQALHLSVCDVTGRRIATLHAGTLPAGEHAFAWSARDAAGRPVAPGLYFLRLETRERSETRRLVLAP